MRRAPAVHARRALAAAVLIAVLIPTAGAFSAHPVTPAEPVASPRVVPAAADDGGSGGATPTPDPGADSTPGGDNGDSSGGDGTPSTQAPSSDNNSDNGGSTSGPATPSAGAEPSQGAEPSEAPPVPDRAAIAEQRRAANAARRAQHASAAARSATAGWNRAGRPDRLIIVRSRNVDLVTGGQLTSRIARTAGAVLSWRSLARYVPPNWLALNNDGTALLSAALVLTPGTALDSGTEIRILRLAGGPVPGAAASIWLSRAQLRLHNIEITSVDAATQSPLPDTAHGRPFLVAGAGATLTIADATLRNLGGALAPLPVVPPAAHPAPAHPLPAPAGPPPAESAPSAPGAAPGPPPAPRPTARPGVLFAGGSTGSVTHTVVIGNTVGLQLAGSRGVTLDNVTLDHSSTDGLVLHGDQGTVLRGVQSTANGRNGVLVSGVSSNRVITGITTVANAAFGVAVVRQVRPQITGISGNSDQGGGLRLTGTAGAVVSNATLTDETVGVLVNGTNDKTQLTNVRVQGGQDGIVLTHAVTGASITASNVENTAGTGVKISGGDTQVRSLSVLGAAVAVRITPTARAVDVVDPSVSSGGDGFVISRGAQGVTLTNPTIQSPGRNGIKTAAANTRIIGGQIVGGATGINARAATTVSGTAITNAGDGIRTSPGGGVAADHVDVLGGNVGVKVEPDTTITVTDSRIRSRDSLRGPVVLVGNNVVSPPPFNWIAALGVLFVLLALVLETTAAGRLRAYRRRAAAFASSAAGLGVGVGVGLGAGVGRRLPGGPASDAPTMAIPITEPPTIAIPVAEPPTEAIPILEPPTMAIPVIDPPTTAIPIVDPVAEPPTTAIPIIPAADATEAPAPAAEPEAPEAAAEPEVGEATAATDPKAGTAPESTADAIPESETEAASAPESETEAEPGAAPEPEAAATPQSAEPEAAKPADDAAPSPEIAAADTATQPEAAPEPHADPPAPPAKAESEPETAAEMSASAADSTGRPSPAQTPAARPAEPDRSEAKPTDSETKPADAPTDPETKPAATEPEVETAEGEPAREPETVSTTAAPAPLAEVEQPAKQPEPTKQPARESSTRRKPSPRPRPRPSPRPRPPDEPTAEATQPTHKPEDPDGTDVDKTVVINRR